MATATSIVVGCGPLNSEDVDPDKIFQVYEVTFHKPHDAPPYTTVLANFRTGGNIKLTGLSRVIFNDQQENSIDLLQNYRWRTDGLQDVTIVYINIKGFSSIYSFSVSDAPAVIDLVAYGFNDSLSLSQLNSFKYESKAQTSKPQSSRGEKEKVMIQVTQGRHAASFSFDFPLPATFAIDLSKKSQQLDTGNAVLTIQRTRNTPILHPESKSIIGRKVIATEWTKTTRLVK